MEDDAIDNTTSHDDEDWLEFLMAAEQTETSGDSVGDLGKRLMDEYMEEWGGRDQKTRSPNCGRATPGATFEASCSGTLFDEEFESEMNRILEQQPKPERRGFFRRLSSSALDKRARPEAPARRGSWFATTRTSFLRRKSRSELIKKEECPGSPSNVDTVSLTEDSTWDLSDMGERSRAHRDEQIHTTATSLGLDGEIREEGLQGPASCDTDKIVAGNTNWWDQWNTDDMLKWPSIEVWKHDNFPLLQGAEPLTSLIERVSSDTMKEVEMLGTLVTESFDRLVVKPTIGEATSST